MCACMAFFLPAGVTTSIIALSMKAFACGDASGRSSLCPSRSSMSSSSAKKMAPSALVSALERTAPGSGVSGSAAGGGLAMLSCFVLRQDSAQARFVWHQDNNFPHVKLTIVYLLTVGASTMRVAGFDSFVYESQGCGVAFPSAAHHRSGGCSHPGTMKVSLRPSRPSSRRAPCHSASIRVPAERRGSSRALLP